MRVSGDGGVKVDSKRAVGMSGIRANEAIYSGQKGYYCKKKMMDRCKVGYGVAHENSSLLVTATVTRSHLADPISYATRSPLRVQVLVSLLFPISGNYTTTC